MSFIGITATLFGWATLLVMIIVMLVSNCISAAVASPTHDRRDAHGGSPSMGVTPRLAMHVPFFHSYGYKHPRRATSTTGLVLAMPGRTPLVITVVLALMAKRHGGVTSVSKSSNGMYTDKRCSCLHRSRMSFAIAQPLSIIWTQ